MNPSAGLTEDAISAALAKLLMGGLFGPDTMASFLSRTVGQEPIADPDKQRVHMVLVVNLLPVSVMGGKRWPP